MELDVDNLQEAELTKDANHNAVLSAQVVSSFRPAPKSVRERLVTNAPIHNTAAAGSASVSPAFFFLLTPAATLVALVGHSASRSFDRRRAFRQPIGLAGSDFGGGMIWMDRYRTVG